MPICGFNFCDGLTKCISYMGFRNSVKQGPFITLLKYTQLYHIVLLSINLIVSLGFQGSFVCYRISVHLGLLFSVDLQLWFTGSIALCYIQSVSLGMFVTYNATAWLFMCHHSIPEHGYIISSSDCWKDVLVRSNLGHSKSQNLF